MEDNHWRRLLVGAQSKVDAIVAVDDTSTTAISPAMFEACCVGVTDARAALAHAAGKLYFHHFCGLIRDLLALYRRTGMDAVHGFTVPPWGNVTVAEGHALLGPDITIIATVQALADPMEPPAKVRAQIQRMVRAAAPGDHFILNVVAFPDRTMNQTKFVFDCCREAGGSPPA